MLIIYKSVETLWVKFTFHLNFHGFAELYLMSLNRFRNGQGKQPVRVYDQVKLFNNGSEKFWRKSNKHIKIESIKTDQISMKKTLLYSLY